MESRSNFDAVTAEVIQMRCKSIVEEAAVLAISKWPKADVIACPKIAE